VSVRTRQAKDEVWVELSVGTQARARRPGMKAEEWNALVVSSLVSPQANASQAPHTLGHTHSTVTFFVNGLAVGGPHPWEGGGSLSGPDGAGAGSQGRADGVGEMSGRFAVRFHQEGDAIEVKVCLVAEELRG